MAGVAESDVVINLVARTESVEKQIAKLTEQLGKAKTEAKKVNDEGLERLVKNGGAMGILNDLTGGLAMQFKDAYESIQLTNTGLKGMRAALLATGIGALVIAIGAIAANWEDIANWANSASESTNKQLEDARAIAAAEQSQLDTLLAQDNVLKLQGKTEKEILEMKMQATNELITANELQLIALRKQREEQIAAAQRNKDILKGIIEFITYPLQIILGTVDEIGAAFGKDFNLREGMNDWLASLAFDPEEVAAENDAAIKELEKAQTALINSRAGYQLSLQEIDKQATQKTKETKKEEKKEEDAAAEEAELKRKSKLEADAAEEKARLERQRRERETEIEIQMLEEEALTKFKEQQAADEAAYKQHLMTSGFALAGQLNDLLSTKQGKQSRDGFRVAKALGIAEAGVNTYKAASAAYATASASPYAILNPGYPAIMAGIAVAFGLAQVAKIASAKYEGGAPSGGGGGGAPSGGGGGGNAPSPTNPQAAIDFSFLNQQKPAQTYVIAGDVTSAQEADQKIKDQSVL